jgi:hypothetical protein
MNLIVQYNKTSAMLVSNIVYTNIKGTYDIKYQKIKHIITQKHSMRLKYYLTKFRVQCWKTIYSSNYIDQIILWKTKRNSITKGFKDEKNGEPER